MPATLPFDVVIGLDRSDRKADVYIIAAATGETIKDCIPTSPEVLSLWVDFLRQRFPQAQIAICLEQPASNLMAFFCQFNFITLYPINPLTLQKFREAFVTSRAKDDALDARFLADLLLSHHDKLTAWLPEDPETMLLQQLVVHRRTIVNERVSLTNRLQALLKQYFPQALHLCGEDLWRPLATDFLLKWPTLQSVKGARVGTLKKFYYTHGSRSQTLIESRLNLIADAIPLTNNSALLNSYSLRIKLVVQEIKLVQKTITNYEAEIATVFKRHPDRDIFQSLPGAGKTLAPRLLSSVGTQREKFPTVQSLLTFSAIAPVTKRSGNKSHVHRRYLCSKFLRQSFHEFAKESVMHCRWAAAYYKQQDSKGVAYNTIIRGLAYKWIRIIWRCWRSRTPYDNARYEAALKRSSSPLAAMLHTVETPCKLDEEKQ